jgi:hypothetical protein
MIFTSLYHFLKYPRIKIKRADFLHLGSFDPRALTRGARGTTCQAMLDQSTWPVAGHGVLARRPGSRPAHSGGDGGTRVAGEKSQPDQTLTGGVTSEVGGAGGGPTVAELTAAASDTCGRNGDAGGD